MAKPQKRKFKPKTLHCNRCGGEWLSRKRRRALPKKCPRCGSTLWALTDSEYKERRHRQATEAPMVEIDKEVFEGLCRLQCTGREMEQFFGHDDVTINAWCRRTYSLTFSEVFAQKRTHGKISLRRNMFQMAQNNAAVAIFLSKNYLGMSDKVDVGLRGQVNLQVVYEDKEVPSGD